MIHCCGQWPRRFVRHLWLCWRPKCFGYSYQQAMSLLVVPMGCRCENQQYPCVQPVVLSDKTKSRMIRHSQNKSVGTPSTYPRHLTQPCRFRGRDCFFGARSSDASLCLLVYCHTTLHGADDSYTIRACYPRIWSPRPTMPAQNRFAQRMGSI